jgi:ATP-dependent DNA helicase RecG
MQSLNDQELTQLLAQGESHRCEWTQQWNKKTSPEKLRTTVCAFANDLAGQNAPGIFVVGVDDAGIPLPDFRVSDELLKTLADARSDGQILPPPTLIVEKRYIALTKEKITKEIALVTVWPSIAPPVRFNGRIHIRVGPSQRLATGEEERILNEKRRFKDQSYDAHPVSGPTLADINRVYFEYDYLARTFHPDVLEANGRSYEERLASLGMIVSDQEPVPTVAGILVLGTQPRRWIPGAYIQFLRIRGWNLGDPVVDHQEIDGNLETIVRRLEEKMQAILSHAIDIQAGFQARDTSAYPWEALKQLLRNAVLHRSYENTHAPIMVYWFDDRIVISNPGGPYGRVTLENFGQPGQTDYRNPRLADAMKALKLVERFGCGIELSQRALAQNGNPPLQFEVSTSDVKITIYRRGTAHAHLDS